MTEENKSNEVLLPCPFCGGKASVEIQPTELYKYDWWKIQCLLCGANIRDDLLEDVVAKWNKREANNA